MRKLISCALSVAVFTASLCAQSTSASLTGLVTDPSKAVIALKATAALATMVGVEVYGDFEGEARKRLGARDPEDWQVLVGRTR